MSLLGGMWFYWQFKALSQSITTLWQGYKGSRDKEQGNISISIYILLKALILY